MTGTDRIQRILMGFVLLVLNLLSHDLSNLSLTAVVSLFLQIELLLTGLVGWCPLYWSLSFVKK